MKKTISALIVLLSTFAFSGTSSAVDLAVGVSGNLAVFAGHGEETNTTRKTDEYGAMDASHGAIFAEVGINDQLTLGVEFLPGDIDSPENTNVQRDGGTTAGGLDGTAQTNKVSVSFTGMYTLYGLVNLPGPIDGLYAKLGYVNATAETKESLGTGGSYPDVDIDGISAGLGYNHDADNGFFVRVEILGHDMDTVEAKNTTDSTKKVVIKDIIGASAALKIGKTF